MEIGVDGPRLASSWIVVLTNSQSRESMRQGLPLLQKERLSNLFSLPLDSPRNPSSSVLSMSTNIQTAIDNAFNKSATALAYCPSEQESKDTKLYILKKKAYYDLQAYVKIGLDLPRSVDRFRDDYPEAQLEELTKLDPNVYDVRRFQLSWPGSPTHHSI